MHGPAGQLFRLGCHPGCHSCFQPSCGYSSTWAHSLRAPHLITRDPLLPAPVGVGPSHPSQAQPGPLLGNPVEISGRQHHWLQLTNPVWFPQNPQGPRSEVMTCALLSPAPAPSPQGSRPRPPGQQTCRLHTYVMCTHMGPACDTHAPCTQHVTYTRQPHAQATACIRRPRPCTVLLPSRGTGLAHGNGTRVHGSVPGDAAGCHACCRSDRLHTWTPRTV